MINITLDNIVKVLKNKNYTIFDGSNYDLNIVGVRTNGNIPNSFDDTLSLFYKLDNGEWFFKLYKITTDPGLYWLNNPTSSVGTAILKEGQYRGAYRIGLHQNKYEALVQNKPLTVIRDYNKDNKLDFVSGHEETGLFGINIHCSKWEGESIQVDKWSAGCQVFAKWNDFQEFLKICKMGVKNHPSTLTYTLINQSDFK